MKEKYYEKSYDFFAPATTFARVANRMLKEAEEVFGKDAFPEIVAAAEHIKKQEDFEPLEYDQKRSSAMSGDERTSAFTCEVEEEYYVYGGIDHNEYGEPTYDVHWYFFTVDHYETNINGKKIVAHDYGDFLRKQVAEKGKYRYFCVYRPPSSGGIPDGAVTYNAYGVHVRKYCGEATYNRLLTDEEMDNWGLVFDTEWAGQRAYRLGENCDK